MEMLRIDIWNVLFTVINLIVLCVLMRIFLFKPITGILEKRKELIEGDLDSAKQANDKAQELLRDHEAKLSTVKEEADELIAQSKKRARNEYDKIVKDANSQAGDILSRANDAAQQTLDKALADAGSQVAELAVEAAKKILTENSNAELDSSAYDSFLKEAEGGAHDE